MATYGSGEYDNYPLVNVFSTPPWEEDEDEGEEWLDDVEPWEIEEGER